MLPDFEDQLLDDDGPIEYEHLFKKYLPKNKPDSAPDQMREKLRDPNFLPTREQIAGAFVSREEWFRFCFDESNQVFEFLNEEYLNALADYFFTRIVECGASPEKPLTILEIGAGNGKLSHFLRKKLEERAPSLVNVIATDSGEWTLQSAFPTEQLRHDEALLKYKPDIVIFSWMPYQKDATKDIRKVESVQEYILIGETDGGCCGDEWVTWGFDSYSYDDEKKRTGEPPFIEDGFIRENHDDLSDLQICRTDQLGYYTHSRTVSFKRKRKT